MGTVVPFEPFYPANPRRARSVADGYQTGSGNVDADGRMTTNAYVAAANRSNVDFGSLEHGLIVVQCAAAGLVYPTDFVSIQAQPEGLIRLSLEIGIGIHLDKFSPHLHG